ncbi:MAG: NADH-quinone oxidoreductase subunit J [Phaeospirillum sp.]|nr:NADH-quinone oxidoreductase subunit J [Phaeospirillum sp.]
MFTALIFYMFSGLAVASGVMVISSRNPVHSVLWLILAFFNAAGLFLLLGAEFLAMVLVIVYVGAVAVLFLFVVMMLDINMVEFREGFLQYLPTGALIGLVLLMELLALFGGWAFAPDVEALLKAPTPTLDQASNTVALGKLIYTNYVYLFQASGLVLLVAMIGTIVLTHRTRTGVRKQVIADQVNRSSKSVELRKIQTGRGI